MAELSLPQPLRTEFTAKGADILKFLQDDPSFLYAIFARNSSRPLCRMRFLDLATSVPEWMDVAGLGQAGKLWAFHLEYPADEIADSLSVQNDDPETIQYIRSAASRLCRICGKAKLLTSFPAFSRRCLSCATTERSRQAECTGNLRRCREIRGGAQHSEAEWETLLAATSGRCLRCGSTESITRDHIVPLLLGGSNAIENIQPLCRSCNSWKSTKIIDFRANTPKLPREVPPQDQLSSPSAGSHI